MNLRAITTIEELQALDRTIKEMCKDLPIEPGSLSRLHNEFYEAYNIFVPPELSNELEAYSLSCFESEWSGTDAETNRAIERAIMKANIESGNLDLNGQVAKMVLRILKSIYREKKMIKILDIGAGVGDTTAAVLDALWEDKEDGRKIAEKCYFKLLEPSWWRLEDGRETLAQHPISSEVYHGITSPRIRPKCDTLETYLNEARKGDVDIVISSAALHHISFPAYLQKLNEHMADDGVIVIGDWYNNLLRHPANLADIIQRLGADNDVVRDFELLFNTHCDEASRIERTLSPEQVDANKDFRRFVVAQGDEMRKMGCTSKIAFLESLNTIEVRLKEMNDAGIWTNINELRLNHKGFARVDRNIRRTLPGRSVAFVVAGAKLPQKQAA
jgi:SAM-dependent methyltransferase